MHNKHPIKRITTAPPHIALLRRVVVSCRVPRVEQRAHLYNTPHDGYAKMCADTIYVTYIRKELTHTYNNVQFYRRTYYIWEKVRSKGHLRLCAAAARELNEFCTRFSMWWWVCLCACDLKRNNENKFLVCCTDFSMTLESIFIWIFI